MVWGAVNAGVAANAIPQTGHPGRHRPHRQPRDLAGAGGHCPRNGFGAPRRRWASSTRCSYRRGVPPVVNEEVSTRIFSHAIEAVGPDALADTRQSGGGEDFSWYLEEVPGAMARLGVWSGRGPQLDLHQPTFDLDERALGSRGAGDGQPRRAVARRSDLALLLRESSLNAQGRRVLRPGADVARRAGPQVVDILAGRSGDLGGVGHHAEVARRRQPALPGVHHVQPRKHGIGGGVRGFAVDAARGSSCGCRAPNPPSGRGFFSSSLVMS